jgi:hypothetical protein
MFLRQENRGEECLERVMASLRSIGSHLVSSGAHNADVWVEDVE